jgi:hypothetical protein
VSTVTSQWFAQGWPVANLKCSSTPHRDARNLDQTEVNGVSGGDAHRFVTGSIGTAVPRIQDIMTEAIRRVVYKTTVDFIDRNNNLDNTWLPSPARSHHERRYILINHSEVSTLELCFDIGGKTNRERSPPSAPPPNGARNAEESVMQFVVSFWDDVCTCKCVGSVGEMQSAVAFLAVVLVLVFVSPLRAWEYRIDGDTTSGLLLVRPDGASLWGTVCDDGFNNVAAAVACRSVIRTARVASATWATWSFQLPRTIPIWMDDVRCSGTEVALSGCSFTDNRSANCDHSADVSITCNTIPDGLELRLSEGSKGTLEMRPNTSAPWGTVCDRNFSTEAAQVVCRTLDGQYATTGYTAAVLRGLPRINGGAIYRSDIQCANASTPFENCTYSTDVAGCTNNSNAGVVCSDWQFRLDSSVNGLTGRLQARPTTASSWGTICVEGFTRTAAMVACRTVMPAGYTLSGASVAAAGFVSNYSTLPVWMTSVACSNASATDLAACSWTAGSACSHIYDAWLQCDVDNSLFRLTNTSFGVVEVRPNATAPWGIVCSAGFDSNAAAAACRDLGYVPPQYIAATYNSSSINGTTRLPTYYSGVQCNATQTFSTCAFASSPSVASLCGGTNYNVAASVRCQEQPGVWEYRLANGSSATNGRLLVRPNPWSPWGTVCGVYFEPPAPVLACLSVFPDHTILSATYNFAGTATGYEGMPIYLTSVTCTGSERHLAACLTNSYPAACGHDRDVLLVCVTRPLLLRLADNSSGLVLTRPDGTAPWSTVCGVGFDVNDAMAVCRELGFSAPQYIAASYNSSSISSTTRFPTYYSGVQCNATQLFTTCPNNYDADPAKLPAACREISHAAAASVRCTAANPVWEYALSSISINGSYFNGSYKYQGRLIARPNAWSTWGTVCSSGFSNIDATVACRSIYPGMSIADARYGAAGDSAGYTTYLILVASCTDVEAQLGNCIRYSSSSSCDHSKDIILQCVCVVRPTRTA